MSQFPTDFWLNFDAFLELIQNRFFRIYAWEKCQELIQKNLICVIIITVSVHHWVFFNEISRNHEFLQIHFHRYLHLNIILTKTFQCFFDSFFQHTFEETLKKFHFWKILIFLIKIWKMDPFLATFDAHLWARRPLHDRWFQTPIFWNLVFECFHK